MNAGHATIVLNEKLDIEGTYPNIESILNISKETTLIEVSGIQDVYDVGELSEAVRRMIGVNLTGGTVNSVEICEALYGLPSQAQWLNHYHQFRNAA